MGSPQLGLRTSPRSMRRPLGAWRGIGMERRRLALLLPPRPSPTLMATAGMFIQSRAIVGMFILALKAATGIFIQALAIIGMLILALKAIYGTFVQALAIIGTLILALLAITGRFGPDDDQWHARPGPEGNHRHAHPGPDDDHRHAHPAPGDHRHVHPGPGDHLHAHHGADGDHRHVLPSVDALVRHVGSESEGCKVAHLNLLFDRSIADGRDLMCSALTLATGDNQGMDDGECDKIYGIYFPTDFLRLFDGSSCSVTDIGRIRGCVAASVGLVVGTIIRPTPGLLINGRIGSNRIGYAAADDGAFVAARYGAADGCTSAVAVADPENDHRHAHPAPGDHRHVHPGPEGDHRHDRPGLDDHRHAHPSPGDHSNVLQGPDGDHRHVHPVPGLARRLHAGMPPGQLGASGGCVPCGAEDAPHSAHVPHPSIFLMGELCAHGPFCAPCGNRKEELTLLQREFRSLICGWAPSLPPPERRPPRAKAAAAARASDPASPPLGSSDRPDAGLEGATAPSGDTALSAAPAGPLASLQAQAKRPPAPASPPDDMERRQDRRHVQGTDDGHRHAHPGPVTSFGMLILALMAIVSMLLLACRRSKARKSIPQIKRRGRGARRAAPVAAPWTS